MVLDTCFRMDVVVCSSTTQRRWSSTQSQITSNISNDLGMTGRISCSNSTWRSTRLKWRRKSRCFRTSRATWKNKCKSRICQSKQQVRIHSRSTDSRKSTWKSGWRLNTRLCLDSRIRSCRWVSKIKRRFSSLRRIKWLPSSIGKEVVRIIHFRQHWKARTWKCRSGWSTRKIFSLICLTIIIRRTPLMLSDAGHSLMLIRFKMARKKINLIERSFVRFGCLVARFEIVLSPHFLQNSIINYTLFLSLQIINQSFIHTHKNTFLPP